MNLNNNIQMHLRRNMLLYYDIVIHWPAENKLKSVTCTYFFSLRKYPVLVSKDWTLRLLIGYTRYRTWFTLKLAVYWITEEAAKLPLYQIKSLIRETCIREISLCHCGQICT